MIVTLFRQDPACRGLGLLLLGGGLVGLLFRSLASTLPASTEALSGSTRGWIFFATTLVVFSSLTILFQQNFMTRASRMALALPIAAPTLWRVRILSILLASVLPLSLATLIAASGARGEVGELLLIAGLRGCTVLMLVAFLFQCLDSDLHMVQTGPHYLIYVASLSCAAVLYVGLVPLSWISVLLPALAALAAGAFIHAHTPLAYLLAPTQLPPLTQVDSAPPLDPDQLSQVDSAALTQDGVPQRPTQVDSAPLLDPDKLSQVDSAALTQVGVDSPAALTQNGVPQHPTQVDPAPLLDPDQLSQVDSAALTQVGVDDRWILHRTIFSTLINHWLNWMIAGGCTFIGLATVLSYGSGGNPMPHLFISLLWPVSILEQAVIRLHRIDHLPIPRGRIFAYVALTLLIPMVVGGSLGGLGLLDSDPASHVRSSQRRLHVPPETWEILTDAPVPTVTAPWGEAYTPREHRLYPGSSSAVYNPYESGADSSDRFRALQANRAVRAVHGRALFADEAFTDPDDDNPIWKGLRQEPAQGSTFLVPGFEGDAATSRTGLYAVGCGVAILLVTLLWSLNLLRQHPRVARWIATTCYLGLFGLVAAYYLATIIEDISGFSEALLVLPMILLRRLARAIPLAVPLLWLGNLPLALACYFLVRGLFCTIEAPTGKVRPIWKEYG